VTYQREPRRFAFAHSLTITLVVLLAAHTAAILVLGPGQYRAYELDPGEPFNAGAYWQWFAFEYNLSILADVYGAIILVVGTKWLHEVGSPEAGD
jgi:hypothetical protein